MIDVNIKGVLYGIAALALLGLLLWLGRGHLADITAGLQLRVHKVREVWLDGERVCARFIMRGTFLSTVMGLLPTGEEFAVMGIDTFRVVNGKVTEIHASYDTLGQMQQLGVVKL